jgi:hypothetical protein
MLAAAIAAAAILLLLPADEEQAPIAADQRLTILEDHDALIRSKPAERSAALRELKALGVDTVRVLAKWNEIAPSPSAGRRPSFDAADPDAYPGFEPYDAVVRGADELGLQVFLTLSPEAPRWATADRLPIDAETVNLRPDPKAFGDFAAAVARRYSGDHGGLPAVRLFSVWNEPNHSLFLKPNADSPEIYRNLVSAALPRLRQSAASDARVLIGDTAGSERAGVSIGPGRFIREFLCLDERFEPLEGAAAAVGCTGFRGFEVDGFATHPYGGTEPASRRAASKPGADVVNLVTIRRLGRYLDRAAAAGRLPANLPIYNTEFGVQSNPPDPTVTTTPDAQARLLNEREEYSFRYERVRSYAQYLLHDDPPREGTTQKAVWSGFQTGLRYADARVKPAWGAFRLPIVVTASGAQARIWGRVRPGTGKRAAQLQRRVGNRFVNEGDRVTTDEQGYFELTAPAGTYRFLAYDEDGRYFASSRAARPTG